MSLSFTPNPESNVIDEPEFFATEVPHSIPPLAAVSYDAEETQHENQQEFFIPLQLEAPPATANEEVLHTTPPPPESHHEPVLALAEEVSVGPQPKVQPSLDERENQEFLFSKVTQPEASPVSCEV